MAVFVEAADGSRLVTGSSPDEEIIYYLTKPHYNDPELSETFIPFITPLAQTVWHRLHKGGLNWLSVAPSEYEGEMPDQEKENPLRESKSPLFSRLIHAIYPRHTTPHSQTA